MKLGMDEVLKVPYKCCCFSARSVQGRIQGGAKIGHGGPLLQETSSSDGKATATNRMHSSDLETCGKKCCYFGSSPKANFWRVFDVFLDLVKFALFNAISIDFYAVKSFICINFRRVGSIFRLRGHQKCKLKIKSRSRNLITKWTNKIKDTLKLTPPPPTKKKMGLHNTVPWAYILQKAHKVLSLSQCKGRALQYEKRLLPSCIYHRI